MTEDGPAAPGAAGPAASEKRESLLTVLIALAANLLVAIAKSVAAAITGSASMVAESAHSWADTGNQVFLFIADRRAAKPEDERHPLGYGREAYVWSLLAAFGLFAVGAVVSVQHGIAELLDPEPATDFAVSYVVLGLALLLEGTSFVRALRQARRQAAEREDDVVGFVLGTSDPTLRAVFFEDAAALVGLVIAFGGILLHQLTGSATPDAVGSILVGVLLGVVAIVLIAINRRFLVGQEVTARVRSSALATLLDQPEIESVSYLHIEYVGPDRVFFIAAIDLAGDAPEHTVAAQLNLLEQRFQSHPRIARAFLTLAMPGAPGLRPSPAHDVRGGSSLGPVVHHLTRDEARRIAVRAQLLDADRPGDVVEVAEQLGEIKIDPTATIAPAEHTILWSRIGWSYEAGQLRKAAEDDRLLIEYQGTFRPASALPFLLPLFRATRLRDSTRAWLTANRAFQKEVLARLRAEGPLLASDIPDTSRVAKAPDGWSGSNQTTLLLDLLGALGEVAVAGREGRRKRWDLAERVFGDVTELPFDEAERRRQEQRLQAFGIAKQRSPWTPVGEAGEPATVEGLTQKYRVDPEALAALDDDAGGRVAFLNPYDGFLFDRPRLKELFEFAFVLEQFKPEPQRRYGYFAHPILLGDRFVGMLDAQVDRKAGLLRVSAVHEFLSFESEEHEMVRAELDALGEWLGMPVVEGAGAD